MDRFFRPNRWLVLFCAVFIILCACYQLVAHALLIEIAKHEGTKIFTWDWPSARWKSEAVIKEVGVIRRNNNDAIVKVKGKQILTKSQDNQRQFTECGATLLFYKNNSKWILGRADFK